MEHFETIRASGLNDLSDPLLGIYNRNYHDRKSFFYRRPGSYRGVFGIERIFDLPVYFKEEPFLDGPRLTLWHF